MESPLKEEREKAHLVVVNVFERVADHADAHVEQVGRGHLEDLL